MENKDQGLAGDLGGVTYLHHKESRMEQEEEVHSVASPNPPTPSGRSATCERESVGGSLVCIER